MRYRSRIAHLAIATLGLLFFATTAGFAQQTSPPTQIESYKIADLGDYKGFDTEPVAIDNKGEVLAEAITSKDKMAIGPEFHRLALVWNNGIWTQLPVPAGTIDTVSTGLSRSGWIVIVAKTAGAAYICVWSHAGDPRTDYPLTGDSLPTAINDTGEIVGFARGLKPNDTFLMSPVLWRNGNRQALVAPEHSTSSAESINDTGDIVGHSADFDIPPTNSSYGPYPIPPDSAVLWHNGKMTHLETLGGLNSYAESINDAGEIVGLSDLDRVYKKGVEAKRHACMWKNGKIVDLGTLGGATSDASQINNIGQIIGVSEIASASSLPSSNQSFEQDIENFKHSFLSENGKMIDLEFLIPKGSGWKALVEGGINDNGQIVGTGYLNGKQRPFLMSPVASQTASP